MTDTTSAPQPHTLIPAERARDYQDRWTSTKGRFVDEPRAAVREADALVSEVLDELEQVFRRQRAELERGLDDEQASTEDLRQALSQYRGLLDRLLTF